MAAIDSNSVVSDMLLPSSWASSKFFGCLVLGLKFTSSNYQFTDHLLRRHLDPPKISSLMDAIWKLARSAHCFWKTGVLVAYYGISGFLFSRVDYCWDISYFIPAHTIRLIRREICHRKHNTSVERLRLVVCFCIFQVLCKLPHGSPVFLTSRS